MNYFPEMSPYRSVRTSLVLVLAFSFPLAEAAAKHKPKFEPGDLPPVGIHNLHGVVTQVGDACVMFDGYISDSWKIILTNDYFAALKRVDTPNGVVFYRGTQIVTDFPDQVYIRAFSGVARCSRNMKMLGPWPTATPDFLKNLRAEAVYVRDLQRHPVEITEIEEGGIYMGVHPMLQFPTYYYLWVLKTKGIQLADPLVVNLISKDGTNVGRFTVDLAGQTIERMLKNGGF